ncbi:MAG TPA: hypothetical protein VGF24_10405 [Vicinamibacterales bacterium]|jgi:hypothetical protein
MSDATLLPPLFAAWINEWLDGLPTESHATCDRCTMCASGPHVSSDGYFFDREIKCCTFLPRIPNFIAGRILRDEGDDLAHGRATLDERLAAGTGVTPFGLSTPPTYDLLYANAQDFFGRAHELRCPHYVARDGRCGIWRHREATCATWFCKHERGATGQAFWTAMRDLLHAVEHDLARWCVLTLVRDQRALASLAVADSSNGRLDAFALDGRSNPDVQRELWGDWVGRERDFFIAAASLVDPLRWNDVLAICGPAVRLRMASVRVSYQRLTDATMPRTLHIGRHEIIRRSADSSTLRTYSDFDPLTVPQGLLDVLPYFDGRPTADACQAIAKERGLVLTSGHLQELIDFRILLESDESSK